MYADDNQGRLVRSVYTVYWGGIQLKNSNCWALGSMDDNVSVYSQVQPGVLDSTNLNGLRWGTLFPYAKETAVYRCPSDPSQTGGLPRVRSYSLNGWMNGATVLRETNYTVFRTESQIINPSPSAAWVFIDEHERSINDGFFAVDMVGNAGLLDLPATRHHNQFGITFADGHSETWKITDQRTINWTRKPVSNNPLNADWQRLSSATSSLAQ